MRTAAVLGACHIAVKGIALRSSSSGGSSSGARRLLPAATRQRQAPHRPGATAADATLEQQAQPASSGHQQPVQQLHAYQKDEAYEGPTSRFEQLLQQGARLTHVAQELCGQVVRPGDLAVDATCGNGYDTAFLAAAVGSTGTVHAFDVQEAAIAATQQRVAESLSPGASPALHYHLASHAEMLHHVGANCARAVMLNLGFLPGSDKATITQASSTVAAVQAACQVLQPGGVCSILCYTGHPGGMEEYEAVRAQVAGLPPSGWVTSEMRLLNRPTAPVLLLLWKRP